MSYTSLIFHIVLRTKASQRVLPLDKSDTLYRYIWGIVKNKNSQLYRINGMEDHIHLLVSLHPTIAISDFVRDVKVETSKFLKHTEGFKRFESWSEGYAAFSYGIREKEQIINYIKNQREHHATISFWDEYASLLKSFNIELDVRDWNR